MCQIQVTKHQALLSCQQGLVLEHEVSQDTLLFILRMTLEEEPTYLCNHTTFSTTSMLPRVALEYGQKSCALRASSSA